MAVWAYLMKELGILLVDLVQRVVPVLVAVLTIAVVVGVGARTATGK
jgi:hypothetical protein